MRGGEEVAGQLVSSWLVDILRVDVGFCDSGCACREVKRGDMAAGVML